MNAFITDPLFMSISVQDKIVNRGYSVFDTTKVFGNKIYQLDKHIDRFTDSINRVQLKPKYNKIQMKSILTQLASVSRSIHPNEDIDLRYFYSGGLGTFNLKVDDNSNTFYAVATVANNQVRPTTGVNEITVNVDELRKDLVAVKSTNYMVNSIVQRIAQKEKAYMGIFTDDNGYLLESPTNNIAFVLKDKTFLVPPFDKTLVGTTILRCFDYIKDELIKKNIVKEIRRDYLTIEDVRNNVAEMMLVGGDFVVPVLKIDDVTISQGAGDITKLLQTFLYSDKGFEVVSEEIPFGKGLMI